VILLGSAPLAVFGASIFIVLKMPNPNLQFWTDGWTTTFNICAQVGLVTLVGLVSKNGILIVEFANELQRRGLSKLDAVHEAAAMRLRPVLLGPGTTLALTLVAASSGAPSPRADRSRVGRPSRQRPQTQRRASRTIRAAGNCGS
jgi:multidrug efflux pump